MSVIQFIFNFITASLTLIFASKFFSAYKKWHHYCLPFINKMRYVNGYRIAWIMQHIFAYFNKMKRSGE